MTRGDKFSGQAYDRFSNRPFGVKHYRTIHHSSVDVAHGLGLLFGIGTRPVLAQNLHRAEGGW